MSTYQQLLDELPEHLRAYAVEQAYEHYTPENQSTWRFIMKHHVHFLSQEAHASYLPGLEATGITLDQIPSIESMNEKLRELGWSAVIVDGFVPPGIFMEFNARKILPIAQEIRTTDHTLYTPAPDIVHEAAGHAPMLVDAQYAEFVRKIGEYGSYALYSEQDHLVYEAIRHLSMIKERPDSQQTDIDWAMVRLQNAIAANQRITEATIISRLHWWTVEYGLVGSVENPKLYGAGLLSSLAESRDCLGTEIKKLL